MNQDKRGTRRVSFERPARLINSVGEKSSIRSYNFSRQGAGFTSLQPYKVGEYLSMILDVGRSGKTQIMQIEGTVVHQRKQEDTWFMGMQFLKK